MRERILFEDPLPNQAVYAAVMEKSLEAIASSNVCAATGESSYNQAYLGEALVSTGHERIEAGLLRKAQIDNDSRDQYERLLTAYLKSGEVDKAEALLRKKFQRSQDNPYPIHPDTTENLTQICLDRGFYHLLPLIYQKPNFSSYVGNISEYEFLKLHQKVAATEASDVLTWLEEKIPAYLKTLLSFLRSPKTEAFKSVWDKMLRQFDGPLASLSKKVKEPRARYELSSAISFLLENFDVRTLKPEEAVKIFAEAGEISMSDFRESFDAIYTQWFEHLVETQSITVIVKIGAQLKDYRELELLELAVDRYRGTENADFDFLFDRFKAQKATKTDNHIAQLNYSPENYWPQFRRLKGTAEILTEELLVALTQKDHERAQKIADSIRSCQQEVRTLKPTNNEYPKMDANRIVGIVIARLGSAKLETEYLKLKQPHFNQFIFAETSPQKKAAPRGVDWYLARNNPAGALEYFLEHDLHGSLYESDVETALKLVRSSADSLEPICERIMQKEAKEYKYDHGAYEDELISFLTQANKITPVPDKVWHYLYQALLRTRERGEGLRDVCSHTLDLLFKGLVDNDDIPRAWQMHQKISSRTGIYKSVTQSFFARAIEKMSPDEAQRAPFEQGQIPAQIKSPADVALWVQELTLGAVLQEPNHQEKIDAFQEQMITQGSPADFKHWAQHATTSQLRVEIDRQSDACEFWKRLDETKENQRRRALSVMVNLKVPGVQDIIRSEIGGWEAPAQIYFLRLLAKHELISPKVSEHLQQETKDGVLKHFIDIFMISSDLLDAALEHISHTNVNNDIDFLNESLAHTLDLEESLNMTSQNHYASLPWATMATVAKTFGRVDKTLWNICKHYQNPLSIAALKEIEDAGLELTPHLAAQYVGQPAEDRSAFLEWCHETLASFDEGNFDPEAFLHVDLEYTRFKGLVAHEKLKHHIKNGFTFADYLQIFESKPEPSDDPTVLSRREMVAASNKKHKQFEIECVAHEAKLLKDFISSVIERAKVLGREVLVVPNLSYGYLPVSPLVEELEDQGADLLVGTKVGSTESHSNPGVFSRHTFKRKRTEIVNSQPIIVVVDGTQHLISRDKEKKSARYPDAHQGYLNQAIALNKANGFETPFSDFGDPDRRQSKLDESNEFERAVATYAELRHPDSPPAQPYDFQFWNTAGKELVIRSKRSETQTITPVSPREIMGPSIIFCNVGVTHDQLPPSLQALKQEGFKEHIPAYFDDRGEIINLSFSFNAHGTCFTNQLEQEVLEAYQRQTSQATTHRDFPMIVEHQLRRRIPQQSAEEAAA